MVIDTVYYFKTKSLPVTETGNRAGVKEEYQHLIADIDEL